MIYDVIIIGGGPCGLSAALALGRCRRRTLVIDSGSFRNAPAEKMYGFLSRDATPPTEFLAEGRRQLEMYPTIEYIHETVVSAMESAGVFSASLADGRCFESRKLLLATGVIDQIPPIEGIGPLWGHTVHVCPYCNGWELRDQPLAVLGPGDAAADLALEMLIWSSDVVLILEDSETLSPEKLHLLEAWGVPIRKQAIARLEGEGGRLRRIAFDDGSKLDRAGLYLSAPQTQRSGLPEQLGCDLTEEGQVACSSDFQSTNLRGLYVAGNASAGLELVVLAAAEGTKAAFAINEELLDDLLATRSSERKMPEASSATGARPSEA
jgi:thioredoxin reductase